jgi:hypothetical protein
MANRSRWALGFALVALLVVLTPAAMLAVDASYSDARETRNASATYSDTVAPPAETGRDVATTLGETVPWLAWVGAVAALLGILTIGGTVAFRSLGPPGPRRRT